MNAHARCHFRDFVRPCMTGELTPNAVDPLSHRERQRQVLATSARLMGQADRRDERANWIGGREASPADERGERMGVKRLLLIAPD